MEYRNNGYHPQWIHSLSGGHQIGAIHSDHINNANHNELNIYNVQPACIEQSAKNKLGIQVRNLEYIYKAKKTGLDNLESLIKPNKKLRSTKEILSNVNINIQRGTVYGLLGPSGCGKTTLLRCIVGCLPITKGEIAIFGYKPRTKHSDIPGKKIGYMPQEFALYEDLSIYETLYYFGRIYNLSRSKINQRIKQLMTMLDMPEASRNVARLSGGQRRRVSFAVSLIHDPELLILDEPTAGVDPLLRERVWVYLLQLCQTRMTTVILTTQYIEETRRAHRVAFMRQGRIIVEQSPDNLLAKYDTQTLEDAFLKICLHEKMIKKKKNNSIRSNGNALMNNNAINNHSTDSLTITNNTLNNSNNTNNGTFSDNIEYGPIIYEHRKPYKAPFVTRISNWLMVFFALMWKNYLTDLRDPLAVCFQFVLPITQVILFSLCIGGSPINIPVGVVNEEALQPGGADLSNLFIRHINNSLIKIKEYDDMDLAWKAAKNLEVWAIVHIRSNFSDAVYHKYENPESEEYYSTYEANLDRRIIEAFEQPTKHDFKIEDFNPLLNSRITVHADMTNKIVTLTTMRNFFNQYQDFIREMLKINSWNHKLARLPVQMRDPIYGQYKEYDYNGFRDFMIPGIMCNITFAIAYTLTAVNLIKERNGQTIERNFVSGVDRTQLLTAHALARFSFMVPYAIVIIYLPVIMFELPALGNLVIVFWLLIMINCTGMIYGMLVSSICATVEMAIILAAGTMFFLMFACGAIWPLESVPTHFKWFAYSTPLALPTEAMRNVLFKGWTIDKFGVWSGFVVCFIYMIIFAFAGLKMFKFNK